MKYLNCIKQWLHTGKIIRETDFLTCCVVLIACFFVGTAIHCHTEQEHLETSGQILHPETENWGLGFGQTGEKPTGNVSAEELKKYHAAYMDLTDEKVIYLTFDAGYENGNTPAILEALKKHDASATFFVVGNYLETSPELVKQMVAEGHTVGNHTFHHPEMSKISDAASFEKELKDVKHSIRKLQERNLPASTDHRRGNITHKICRWPAILDIRHFSGALPMWTGSRISSPQKKLPLINY